MQLQNKFSTPPRAARRRAPFVLLWLVASVWSQTALAAWWLSDHVSTFEGVPFRAPASAVLLLLSGLQAAIAWRAWRLRNQLAPVGAARWRMFLRWVSVGFVVCYGVGMLTSAGQGGVYLFALAMAIWHMAALLPLVGTPAQLSRVVALLERRGARAVGWTAYALLMTPLIAELALRTYAEFFSGPAGASYLAAQKKLPPGSVFGELQINAQGYCDEDFTSQPRPGVYRVAALGGDLVWGAGRPEHFLARIEGSREAVEIYNFALPSNLPADYAAQVKRDVAQYHPQLVLAFVSLGDQWGSPAAGSHFDWRELHTFRLGLNLLLNDRREGFLAAGQTLAAASAWMASGALETTPSADADSTTDAYQAYLDRGVAQLGMCRTPLDERAQRRWGRLFGDLRRLIATCEQADLPLTLILTPSEFQVSPVLRDVLSRRAGYAAEELDWELPQRRLATFAQQHQATLIDLTPHLQLHSGAFARNDHQFSAAGHSIAGEVLGRYVRTRVNTTLADAK